MPKVKRVAPTDLAGLHPLLAASVKRMVAHSFGSIGVASGFRTREKQEQLWRDALSRYGSAEEAYAWVRPPGASMHERGMAVDLAGDLVLAGRLIDTLRLPVHRPIPHEPWHVEILSGDKRAGDGVRLSGAGAGGRQAVVAFTDRFGGVSDEPYHWLNLAMAVGDRREDVAENRLRVGLAAGFEPRALVLSRQVHGTRLRVVSPGDNGVVGEADGLVARVPGVPIGLLTADCAAVVLAGAQGVAIVHAGWRGLAGGIVRRGVSAVGSDVKAWVGPAIRDCCYEVGEDVIGAFRRADLPTGRRRVDISSAASAALTEAGVDDVDVDETCTACDARYFSYRRDGVTGRHGAFALIVDD